MKLKENKIFVFIILILGLGCLIKVVSKDSYAYYSSSNEIPILSTKIGNFAGGDTSELEEDTDINVLYYVQDFFDHKKYYISEIAPLEIDNYKLDEKRSNCIPKESNNEGDKVSYSNYSIEEDTGKVKITVTEDNLHQIVCRIYYSLDLESSVQLNKDINVIPFVEYSEGTMIAVDEIPTSGYKLGSYECKNKDEETKTEITYEDSKLKVKYKGPDLCYVYFNKES